MRRSVVTSVSALVLALAAAGCAEPRGLPAPALGPAAEDSAALVATAAARADEQRSVRFAAENAVAGREVRLDGDLLRAPEGRLLSLTEDGTDVVVLADAGYSRTAGGTWTRHDPGERVPVRADATIGDLPDEVDPAAVVRSLAGALVVARAEEVLDGVPTHRYTMLVDLRVQAERTADSTRRAQLLAADESGFTATAVVWVGPGDLPVRVEQVLTTLEDTTFQRVVHRFSNWNADVRVAAPAP
ncbi:hypothetical protein ACFFSW_26450 [Saccharothrix longispora]|uniref:Lipoprotein LprG n=1 Tax=Saccharothrix longispora TaxID=33920 RepID=A0ABU1PZ40_9PSEU|nr:hypothetical protein [Saccharothrix longispora]MDR6595543.1 hypothetical protein [Saccharothrix longispora]